MIVTGEMNLGVKTCKNASFYDKQSSKLQSRSRINHIR